MSNLSQSKELELINNYVIKEEDLVKVVNAKVKGGTLRKGIVLFLLKYLYRNSYGDVLASDVRNEFNYEYPMHLTDNLNIPVSDYGFINKDTYKTFLDMTNEEQEEQEEIDYINIPFNLEEIRKIDLIKYIENQLEDINQNQYSDFDLVEICHSKDLFTKYYTSKMSEDYTTELTLLESGKNERIKKSKIPKRESGIPPIKEYGKTKNLPIKLVKLGKEYYIEGTDYTLLDDKVRY